MSAAGSWTIPAEADLLQRLCAPGRDVCDCRDVMIVAAHPDDETIALGGQLHRMEGVRILHVTDGAPLDMEDARACGFGRREDYADARRKELIAAMALAGIDGKQLLSLAMADKTVPFRMVELARKLAVIFLEYRIRWVISHDFEGGHPDHDATAFAVHAACHLMQQAGVRVPKVLEFPLYHLRKGCLIVQRFASSGKAAASRELPLDNAAAVMKRRMLSQYLTQRRTLSPFAAAEEERLRRALKRRFLALPNGGEVYYAYFNWGLRPADWPALAASASRELDLPQWL